MIGTSSLAKDPQCTCPHQYKENGLVRHGTDRMCKIHGDQHVKAKTRTQLLLESIREDILGAPQRTLTSKERQFVQDAESFNMVVFYNRKGKPFALGASKSSHVFADEASVSSRPWLFDTLPTKERGHFYWLRN